MYTPCTPIRQIGRFLRFVRVDSSVSSELLTWLVGNLSAFCFKKARVFLSLPIRKADNLRFAPQRANKHSDCSPGGISERKRWTLGRSDTAESETPQRAISDSKSGQ